MHSDGSRGLHRDGAATLVGGRADRGSVHCRTRPQNGARRFRKRCTLSQSRRMRASFRACGQEVRDVESA
jgi:hypothetical protein